MLGLCQPDLWRKSAKATPCHWRVYPDLMFSRACLPATSGLTNDATNPGHAWSHLLSNLLFLFCLHLCCWGSQMQACHRRKWFDDFWNIWYICMSRPPWIYRARALENFWSFALGTSQRLSRVFFLIGLGPKVKEDTVATLCAPLLAECPNLKILLRNLIKTATSKLDNADGNKRIERPIVLGGPKPIDYGPCGSTRMVFQSAKR